MNNKNKNDNNNNNDSNNVKNNGNYYCAKNLEPSYNNFRFFWFFKKFFLTSIFT